MQAALALRRPIGTRGHRRHSPIGVDSGESPRAQQDGDLEGVHRARFSVAAVSRATKDMTPARAAATMVA
jgi:hypothetical protein